jgi:hypothetical protein
MDRVLIILIQMLELLTIGSAWVACAGIHVFRL